jgi:uncharacterized protein YggE
MSRGSWALAVLIGALSTATPALADPAKSVTATGNGVEKVVAKNAHSNSSIQAAVDAARKLGVKDAIKEAHEYALQYAQATGLTLGAVISVSDAQSNGIGYAYGGYGPFGPFGPFAPNQYCGTVRQPVFKVIGGKRKLQRFKKVHRCFVPPFESTTLTVTYSAT